jgi:D-amino-acid oxidase
MTDHAVPGAEVVVVGAGVIGLTSAIRLAEAGHRVRVLTDRPIAATTSAAAGAMLGISGAGPGDPLTTWTERSTPVFDALAENPATGIHHRHGRIHVDVADDLPPWARVLPDFRALGPHETRGFRTGMAVTLPFADMGWRPVRPSPRTEVDDRGVVHAYGHGGVGVTVSWGVADEVACLVATLAR